MTLGDLVKEYREKHNISMKEFANACDLSKGYISMLENNTNPRSNKPIAPTLPTIKKIAFAMGMDVDSVFKILDANQKIILNDDMEGLKMKKAETKDRIREGLSIRNMKQSELVEKTGIDKGQLSSYLSGRYNPKQKNLYLIAQALSVDEAWLMGFDVPMESKTSSIKKEKLPTILQYYEILNDMGKHEATKRVKELTELPRYVNEDIDYVNAAHALEGASEEDKQFDEDIMNDENF